MKPNSPRPATRKTQGLPDRVATILRSRFRLRPRLGIVLGSGFQGVLGAMEVKAGISCSKLPGFSRPSVPGHEGKIVWGKLGGVDVVALAGRVHFYEGHTLDAVTFGIRVLARLSVESVLITNAAGGLNPRFRVGDFMILADHINFMGVNPLRGATPGDADRFVDLTQAYDSGLRTLLLRAGRGTRIPLREGVYLAVSGPSYETPAEIRAFRRLGAEPPEVIVARQQGVRVAALSCITNLAAGIGRGGLHHEEVLAAGARVSEKASRLLERFASLYGSH